MNKPARIATREYYEGLVARNSGDSIVVTDTAGLVVWSNEAFTRLSGYSLDEMLGKKPGQVLQGQETSASTIAEVREALVHRRPIKTEILNFTKGGDPYWIEMHITPVFDENARHTNFMSIERDITARKNLEAKSIEAIQREKFRESERELLGLFSEWLYAAKSTEELQMVIKRSMETLFPEAEGSFYVYSNSRDTLDLEVFWGGANPTKRISPDDCWALRRGRAYCYGTRSIEFPCEHVAEADQPYFCLPIVAHGETIGLLHMSLTGAPIEMTRTELKETIERRWSVALLCAEQISLASANVRLRQELMDQSVRDPLTNLWNRRWMMDAARGEFASARDHDKPIAMLSLDVDHFKKFNDAHGHDAGDQVLKAVAHAMRDAAGAEGQPCRIGGEEFVILCPNYTLEEAAELAARVRKSVDLIDVVYDGKKLPPVTISIGVATFPEDGQIPTEVLKSSDQALYAAKENGRNRVELSRPLAERKARKKTS